METREMKAANTGDRHGARRRDGFTIVELVGAMAILFLLMGCFYASLNGVRRLERVYWSETRAVVVLNNVLERARVERGAPEQRVADVLREEFSQSELPISAQAAVRRDPVRGTMTLGILKDNGKPLAQMDVTP
jgi:hypothetical protein